MLEDCYCECCLITESNISKFTDRLILIMNLKLEFVEFEFVIVIVSLIICLKLYTR